MVAHSWIEWVFSQLKDLPPARVEPSPVPGQQLVGRCGTTEVRIYPEGTERFCIMSNGQKQKFATPYVRHAKDTAELWYGQVDEDGWRLVGKK